MTESEKLDRIFGQEENLTKCFICEHNLEIRCGMGHDNFNNLKPKDFCPNFEIMHEEPEIKNPLANNPQIQDCPLCGEDAVWDPFLQKYVCQNGDCGHEFP